MDPTHERFIDVDVVLAFVKLVQGSLLLSQSTIQRHLSGANNTTVEEDHGRVFAVCGDLLSMSYVRAGVGGGGGGGSGGGGAGGGGVGGGGVSSSSSSAKRGGIPASSRGLSVLPQQQVS